MAAPSKGGRQGDRDDKGLSDVAEGYRKAEPYLAASTSLVISVVAFLGLGIWLDRKVGTTVPWFTMAGAVIGMTAGFISFFRAVLGRKKT